jgi:hypothetical protein
LFLNRLDEQHRLVYLNKIRFMERLVTDLPAIPFPRSYWVISGKLLAGLYPGHLNPAEAERRIQALLDCGIRRVINLMEPDEVNYQGLPFAPYIDLMRLLAGPDTPIAWTRYPIRDGGLPEPAMMKTILDEIDASLAAGQPVYVHCWGGKGRTGTVVGCYLVRNRLAAPDQAVQYITYLRRDIVPVQDSPENDAQRRFVQTWTPGE